MPSAQGISGSISNIIKPEATKAGQSAGRTLATNISKSLGSLGSTLTKSITLPVVGAATAASAFLLKGGWDRIVGLDSARAQLEGLGYDFKAVERISNLVNDSIQGTTMTMADGVSVAAGALAAGVEEGEDLARFIGLVGDAAVGSGREVGEMGMIFNRVQGMGKLMTQELNMIEDGMPGFSQAMAKHFGVGQAEFREMVTAGKVSSSDFLDVMDDFAGGMSDAYAKSWRGIFSRVKSNLAILGEYMLDGMFPDAKEALADFLETIREDDIRNWAKGIGDTIGETFRNVVQGIKDVVNWWSNLSEGTKSAIKTFAGIAVVAGPVLVVLSKLIAGAITIHGWFGVLSGVISAVGGALAGITAPIALAVAGVVGLVGAIVYLYNTNETVRDLITTAWNFIKDMIMQAVSIISEFVQTVIGGLVTWWQENNQMILEAAQNVWGAIKTVIVGAMEVISTIMQTVWPLIMAVVKFAWDGIKNVIQGVVSVITGIIQAFSALFTGNWSALWDAVKQIVTGAVQAVWGLIQLWIVGKIIGAVKAFAGLLKSIISSAWSFVRKIFSSALSWIGGHVSSVFGSISSTISGVMNTIRGVISGGLNAIKGFFSNIFGSLRGVVSTAFNGVRTAVSSGMSRALSTITRFFSRFKSAGSNLIGNIASGIKGAIGKVTGAVKNVLGAARNLLPFSPPKDKSSPLVDIHKNGIGQQIAKGILDGQSEVDKAMRDLLSMPTDLAFDVLGGMNSNFDLVGASGNIQYEVNSANARMEEMLEKLSNREQVIVLDSGELVGATYPQYDRVGGSQTQLTERWGR